MGALRRELGSGRERSYRPAWVLHLPNRVRQEKGTSGTRQEKEAQALNLWSAITPISLALALSK